MNLKNIIQDEYGYVYANLPPSEGCEKAPAIGIMAHLDTSPAVNGKDVKPIIHKNYDGKEIKFADNKELSLNPNDSYIDRPASDVPNTIHL